MSEPFAFTTLYFDDPPQAGRALDVWVPEAPSAPTLFFIHGGGWGQGRRDQLHALMYAFYERGHVCVSADYRLEGTPASTQVGDVREGLALADAYLRERGIRQSIVLYGSSAGGHLALLVGLAKPGACGEDFAGVSPTIAGIVVSCAPVTFEPWEEIFPGSWEAMQKAAGVPWAQNPETYRALSPERHAGAGAPPLLFLLAECEHMFPNRLTQALVERLQKMGVSAHWRVYPDAEHGFFHEVRRKSQKMALQDVLSFVSGLAAEQGAA